MTACCASSPSHHVAFGDGSSVHACTSERDASNPRKRRVRPHPVDTQGRVACVFLSKLCCGKRDHGHERPCSQCTGQAVWLRARASQISVASQTQAPGRRVLVSTSPLCNCMYCAWMRRTRFCVCPRHDGFVAVPRSSHLLRRPTSSANCRPPPSLTQERDTRRHGCFPLSRSRESVRPETMARVSLRRRRKPAHLAT